MAVGSWWVGWPTLLKFNLTLKVGSGVRLGWMRGWVDGLVYSE